MKFKVAILTLVLASLPTLSHAISKGDGDIYLGCGGRDLLEFYSCFCSEMTDRAEIVCQISPPPPPGSILPNLCRAAREQAEGVCWLFGIEKPKTDVPDKTNK